MTEKQTQKRYDTETRRKEFLKRKGNHDGKIRKRRKMRRKRGRRKRRRRMNKGKTRKRERGREWEKKRKGKGEEEEDCLPPAKYFQSEQNPTTRPTCTPEEKPGGEY